MNLKNKTRLTKDIVVYEDFVDAETAAKLIKVLDRHADSGKLTWTPHRILEDKILVYPRFWTPYQKQVIPLLQPFLRPSNIYVPLTSFLKIL